MGRELGKKEKGRAIHVTGEFIYAATHRHSASHSVVGSFFLVLYEYWAQAGLLL